MGPDMLCVLLNARIVSLLAPGTIFQGAMES